MKKLLTAAALCGLLVPLTLSAQEVRSIVFPVDGPHTILNNYGEARSGGRTHEGTDIMTPKMTPLLSAVDGYVSLLPQDEPSYGYAIFIRGDDGYSYRYIHINNDTPGTDDGMGGTVYAYVPTIVRGARVIKGQLIGWAGDSGNAENVGSHLHFEIRTPDGSPIDPYPSLLAALKQGTFDPQEARLTTPTINSDRGLVASPVPAPCQANTLIKGSTSAVYYCGADGRRYVFPNQRIYTSWYSDFTSVVRLTDDELAQVPLGRNVTYRPGVRMVKLETDPRVYAVAPGGVLRYVTTPKIARSLYGDRWTSFVDDLPDTFFADYRIGEPITTPLDK